MVKHSHFDYIIIGNGLAGLQLAIALTKDTFFKNKQIALIDKNNKNINDKTWSFWEKSEGQWDHIVKQAWNTALFYSPSKNLKLALNPYSYKSIHAIDFYNETIGQLKKHANIHFIIDEVTSVRNHINPVVKTKTQSFTANHVFDSIIPNDFYSKIDNYTRVTQHFKGWVIETETPSFNVDEFIMMDYRLKDGTKTSFTYVLPFSKTKALVEFTYFTPEVVSEDVYDNYIEKYIKNELKIDTYTISYTEKGNIPMTNFPFKNYSTKYITKIGTAGGWVKGSTGYSFKHTENKVVKIISNLKQNKKPSKGLFKRRHAFYDKIFLKVLHDRNDKGEWIFEQFYTKNSVETMFKFLDEESSFKEELQIMLSLFSIYFIKAFFKTL